MRPLMFVLCGLSLVVAPAGAQDKTDVKEKIAALLKDLKSNDDMVRYEAITALAEYGPDAADAVPILVKLLEEPNEELRVAATLTLGKIGKSAVAPVAALLNNPDVDIRCYALWTLGNIGPAAKDTAPRALTALNDKEASIRQKAAYALGR